MPHIVIEYSPTVKHCAKPVMQAAHTLVTECGLFSPQAVKARSVCYDEVLLPEGAENFMHMTVSILSGRTVEERANLSRQLFDAAKSLAPELDRLSVDIREMVKESYTK